MKIQPIKALLFMKEDSERVPNKNLKDFNGRPLFHYILDTLTKSEYIKEIIVNTDSDVIANDSSKIFNATIHKRPDHLLVLESDEPYQLLSYDLNLSGGEYFLNTHCTNPLLKIETIDKAIEVFFKKLSTYDSLFSVTKIRKRLFFEDLSPINHDPNDIVKTQNLKTIFEENSNIYIFSRHTFLNRKNRIGQCPYMYCIDKHESIDIDSEIDFLLAENMIQNIDANKKI